MNDFQKKIYEAIGEASMCWKETLKGVFDDVKAKAIGDELCEIYRLQMAGISTAAIGYFKKEDSIHPDYDTVTMRDVEKLYEKYDKLYQDNKIELFKFLEWVSTDYDYMGDGKWMQKGLSGNPDKTTEELYGLFKSVG